MNKYLLFAVGLIALSGQTSFAETKEIKKIKYQKVLILNNFKDTPFAHYSFLLKKMRADGVVYPQAATLSTIKENGFPALRNIGIKNVTDHGFVFYTNIKSNKAQQINKNPHVALLVIWHNPVDKMSYQIRIEGLASKYAAAQQKHIDANKELKIINWQPYIIKPDTVEFSILHMHDGIGVVEYVTYNKSKNQWIKQRKTEDYIAPGGC